jgi:hypothetical protein
MTQFVASELGTVIRLYDTYGRDHLSEQDFEILEAKAQSSEKEGEKT